MKISRTTAATLAAIAMFGTAAATAATLKPSDAKFLQTAIQIDLAEIQTGQLAQQKSQNPAVKDFAHMLVTDHSRAKMDTAALARQMDVKVPAWPDAESKAEYKKLKGLTGAAFDQEFASHMVMGHEQAITLFQAETTSAGDSQVMALAQKELPTLQTHLATAKSLQTKVGNAASN
jgi:putative membrane protein